MRLSTAVTCASGAGSLHSAAAIWPGSAVLLGNGEVTASLATTPAWTGPSPWLNHAVEYALPLAGAERRFPYLENRWAFYGFRDYTASVTSTTCAHARETVGVLELGGETVNGRQSARRLIPVAADGRAKVTELVELADEGLVVEVLPARTDSIDRPVRIVDDANAEAVVRELTEALNSAGVQLATDGAAEGMTLRLSRRASSSPMTVRGHLGPRSP